MHKRKILSALILLGIITVTFTPAIVRAEQPNQLMVSPALVDVELSDANKEQKTQISITNTYLSDIQLTAELKGIDEIGGKLLPTGDVEPGLSQNIVLSKTNFTATAKSSTILEVLVKNSSTLSAGGHYATLVLKQKQKPQSAYSSEISISIFIVKMGGERQDVAMNVLSARQSLVSLPQNIQVSFTNSGNTLVTPRAAAIVSTGNDTIVSKGVANMSSMPLLPSKKLATNIELKQTSFRWYPQKLFLTISYRPDGSEVVRQYQKAFWYVPPVFLIGLLFTGTLILIGTKRALVWKKARKNKSTHKTTVVNKVAPVEKVEITSTVAPELDAKSETTAISSPEPEIAEAKAVPKTRTKVTKKPSTAAKKKTTTTTKKTAKPKKK